MNPYKSINESELVLKTLVNEVKNSKNKVYKLKQLNTLIKSHNDFKELMQNKYYTDYFDVLILSRLYNTLIKDQKELNINEFLIWLDKDIRTGKEFIKENITGYLQGVQMYNSNKKGYFFQDDSNVWIGNIDNLLSQVKEKIVFHKKHK